MLGQPLRVSGSTSQGTQHSAADCPAPASVTPSGLWTARCRGRRALHPFSPSRRPSSSRVRSMIPSTPQAPTQVPPAAAQRVLVLACCLLRLQEPFPFTAPRRLHFRLCAVSPPTRWKVSSGWSLSPLARLHPTHASSGMRKLLRAPLTWSKKNWVRRAPRRAGAGPPGCRGHPRWIPGMMMKMRHLTALSSALRSGQ